MPVVRSARVALAAVALLILALALGVGLAPHGGPPAAPPPAHAPDSPVPAPLPTIAPADEPARLAAVQRFLRASEYGLRLKVSMQQAIESLAQQLPASAPALVDPMQSLDGAALEAAAAPLFARHLTLQQAQEIAAFFESDAGRSVMPRALPRAAAPPDAQEASRHEATIEKFFNSETGRVLQGIASDPEIARAVMQAAGIKRGAAP